MGLREPRWYSRQSKQVFMDSALFFLISTSENQANQLNMQIELSYRYFDYEGHNP